MLKRIVICLQNIEFGVASTYKRIEGFDAFLIGLAENKMEIVPLKATMITGKKEKEDGKQYILEALKNSTGEQRLESLVISDLQIVAETCQMLRLPCMAYENKQIPKQDLFKAAMLVEGFKEVDFAFVLEVYQRYYKQPITIAKTKRLVIRETILEDVEELYPLYEEESITEFLEPLYEKEEEIAFTKAYIENMYGFYGYGLWSLLERNSGILIGRAGLSNREVDGEVQIELGYMIGTHYQKKGYAYEACSAILDFAVNKLEVAFVNCFIHPKNIASIRLVKKLGFAYLQEMYIENEKLSWYRWTDKN